MAYRLNNNYDIIVDYIYHTPLVATVAVQTRGYLISVEGENQIKNLKTC